MYQFIVNPGAGAGRGYRIWKRLEHQLEMNSQEYRVFFTEHQGDAAEIARVLTAEKDEAKVIVIVGGEGTYNEVLNGVSFKGLLTFGYVGGIPECTLEGIPVFLEGGPSGEADPSPEILQDAGLWRYHVRKRGDREPQICRTLWDRTRRGTVPQSLMLPCEKPDDEASSDKNPSFWDRIKAAFSCKADKRIYFA